MCNLHITFLFLTFIVCIVITERVVSPNRPLENEVEDSKKLKRKFTHEWQEIEDDEPIPAGMHISVNLQTGQKKVKLLDKEENSETSIALSKENEFLSNKNLKLEERLKKIPSEVNSPTPEEIEKVKKKFRTYDDLKKDFESLRMSVKTDLEVIQELFSSYEKVVGKGKVQPMEELNSLKILSPSEEKLLNILTDLEYLVHQVDNAKHFVQHGGLETMVYPSLNASSPAIRAEAARLLGSAVQNNAASQIKAVESGAVGRLLRLLALDPEASVRAAGLYALGCVVRRFPLAQRQLTNQGGIIVLLGLYSEDSADHLKMQMKVMTFLDDLLIERNDAELSRRESSNSSAAEAEARERVRQYQQADILSALLDNHWCSHLVKLFKQQLMNKSFKEDSAHPPDLDVIEKVTRAMLSLADPCRPVFLGDPHVGKLLLELTDWLKHLAEQDSDSDGDNYYAEVADQLRLLGSRLGIYHTTHKLPEML